MGYKTICKHCKKHKSVNEKGFCVDCSVIPTKNAIMQMKKKKGKIYKKWAKNLKKGLDKPQIARRSQSDEGKKVLSNLTKARIKPLIFKQCPACLAMNKGLAKKCQICGIRFA